MGGRPADGAGRRGRAGADHDAGRRENAARWARSAARGCSPRSCSGRCSTSRSTWPFTASRTCRPRRSRDCRSPPFPSAKARPMCWSRPRPTGSSRCRRRPASAPAACAARRSSCICGPICVVEDIRGNVETRLRKLDEGEYDAIVLAEAGLKRLGLAERIAQVIPRSTMLPAVGQGALGIEARADDVRHAIAGRAARPRDDAPGGAGRAVAALHAPRRLPGAGRRAGTADGDRLSARRRRPQRRRTHANRRGRGHDRRATPSTWASSRRGTARPRRG